MFLRGRIIVLSEFGAGGGGGLPVAGDCVEAGISCGCVTQALSKRKNQAQQGKICLFLCASVCGTTVKPYRKKATNSQLSPFRAILELLFVKGAKPLSFFIFSVANQLCKKLNIVINPYVTQYIWLICRQGRQGNSSQQFEPTMFVMMILQCNGRTKSFRFCSVAAVVTRKAVATEMRLHQIQW